MALSHCGHSYDRIEAAAEKEKVDLLEVANEGNSAASKLEDAMAKGEKVIQNIKARQQSVDGEIKDCFKDLYETLRHREEHLLAKSSEIGLTKTTAVMLQIENMKRIYNEITRVCGYIREAADTYDPTEVLSAKKIMTGKLSSLIKEFNSCSLDPCKSDLISTKFATSSAKMEIDKIGVVTGGCCATTSTAYLYIPQAIKGKEKKVLITARDIQGKRFLHGGDVVKAELGVVGDSSFNARGNVKDNDDGTYEISVIPQTTGEHQLDITIGNEHIQSSPFIISVREERPYTSLVNLQCFSVNYPWDVAFSDSGEIFIASYNYHCVYVLDKQQGNILRTIGIAGSYGAGDLQFNYPAAMIIHGDMVYVAEEGNHRIQKFTTSGKFVSTFGSQGSGEGQLSSPRGICVDPEGKICVSESSNSRISVFNADGSFDHHISGNLINPWGLAFDPSGNLHVANYSSHNVVVFTSEGKYEKVYGQGYVYNPAGLAIDPEGYVFVSEYKSGGRLVIFSPQSQVLNAISPSLYNGVGIGLNPEGYIYVSDSSNARILKY
jgi:sugar lactone lactonase YvrE